MSVFVDKIKHKVKYEIKRDVIENIKTYKSLYITGGSCLVIGVVGGVLLKNSSGTKVVDMFNVKLFSPTNNIANTINVKIPKPGNSGNMLYCHQNHTAYPSQRSAAKALSLNESSISQYLQGRWPSPKGYTFDKLAESGEALAK